MEFDAFLQRCDLLTPAGRESWGVTVDCDGWKKAFSLLKTEPYALDYLLLAIVKDQCECWWWANSQAGGGERLKDGAKTSLITSAAGRTVPRGEAGLSIRQEDKKKLV